MSAEFDLVNEVVQPYLVGDRSHSTALLAWFLENAWRIGPEEADDAICDGSGDKGIDAIVVDDDGKEIIVFQSKVREKALPTQGDSDLKTFTPVRLYFRNSNGIKLLLDSAPGPAVRRLVARLGLEKKLREEDYSVRLVFVTNSTADRSATDYLATVRDQDAPIEFWGREKLANVALKTRSPGLVQAKVQFAAGSSVLEEVLDKGFRMLVALIPAAELVEKLPGLDDHTVFDLNVRLGAGNTRINKELRETIDDTDQHSLFPAYHNGLTMVTRGFKTKGRRITLDGVSVVNGCQSLLALLDHKKALTPDLRVLVKVVEIGTDEAVVGDITYRTNNQNPVDLRDQRSNDRIQRALTREVEARYKDRLAYIVRTGQPKPKRKSGVVELDNGLAAQLLMAIWIGEPWSAIRRVRLFDSDYHRVFNRAVTADKLYLAHLLDAQAQAHRNELEAGLASSFASVRFTLLHLAAVILKMTPLGNQLLEAPELWLPEKESEVTEALSEIVEHVVGLINEHLEQISLDEEGNRIPDFDPKVVFKSQKGVLELEKSAVRSTKRDMSREKKKGRDFGFNVPVKLTKKKKSS